MTVSATIFKICKRVLCGNNCFAEKIDDEIRRIGAKKVFLVCGPVLAKTAIIPDAVTRLKKMPVELMVYDKVRSEPEVDAVLQAAASARNFGADCVLGIGGGSTLDCAKLCSILITNGTDIHSMYGIEKVPNPGVPLILVPTSAGTGSETTDIAILSDPEANLKLGVVSQFLLPDCVFLDPSLTVSLPPVPTAASGIDALIHALEAYTSVNATSFSDIWAINAIKILGANLRGAWARGDNLKAREAMLMGSFYAGVAFCNAGVTAVHAFAYPIGARYHISHGWANAIMLLPVFRFNMIGNLSRFGDIASFLGIDITGMDKLEAANSGLDALSRLLADVRAPRHLADFGVVLDDVPELARGVMEVKRLLANNPRILAYEDAVEIYNAAL